MEVLRMMKTLLVSAGVVLLAVILKLSLPVTLDILTTELPHLWTHFTLSWLRPPYLYLIINCIIISIVASSKLQTNGSTSVAEKCSDSGVAAVSAAAEEFVAVVETTAEVEVEAEEVVKEVVFGYVAESCGGDVVEEREKSMWISPEIVAQPSEAVVVVEKPPYSVRSGHRKAFKASSPGKTALKKVSRPKRQETLESTWRTLTEGRSMPLTRHLRKSDTFAGANPSAASPPSRVMKKSETFSGGGAESPSPGSGKLKRESSLSQDELNRRVEAFIKKFNEEMRLQRQESFNHYHEMVGHGSH